MALQRLTEQRKKAALGPAAEDLEFKERHPLLYEHLTSRSFAKGEPRKTSTLNIFADQGSWKAFLNERNDGLCLCVSAETVYELYKTLEAVLGQPDADWRPSKFNGGKDGKGK